MGLLDGVRKEIREKMADAVQECAVLSLADMKKEVGQFYAGSSGKFYKRTGALGNTPMLKSLQLSGNTAVAELIFNTDYNYPTQGISTVEIFKLADSGSLPGQGGFVERSLQDIRRNLHDCLSARF